MQWWEEPAQATLCSRLQAKGNLETMAKEPTSVSWNFDDGTDVQIRPVTGDDKDLLLAGFDKLSPRTRYLRFMSPTESLGRRDLAYLTEVDFVDHVAWGVTADGEPVALGRWVRLKDQPRRADVAVTVSDSFQGKGIGTLLIKVLADSARRRDVEELTFDVLSENIPMLGLLEKLGATLSEERPVVTATLKVDDVEAPEKREQFEALASRAQAEFPA